MPTAFPEVCAPVATPYMMARQQQQCIAAAHRASPILWLGPFSGRLTFATGCDVMRRTPATSTANPCPHRGSSLRHASTMSYSSSPLAVQCRLPLACAKSVYTGKCRIRLHHPNESFERNAFHTLPSMWVYSLQWSERLSMHGRPRTRISVRFVCACVYVYLCARPFCARLGTG